MLSEPTPTPGFFFFFKLEKATDYKVDIRLPKVLGEELFSKFC